MATDFGVIGLGIIGYGMASNLRKNIASSATLHVLDLNQDVIQRLIKEFGRYGNIEVASSARDLVNKVGAVVVLSSLPAGPHVWKVYLDLENGVITATNPERLITECSAIEIDSTQELGKTIINAGLGSFVDATVSGGMWGANTGTLSFMVGHAEPTETDKVSNRVHETLSLVAVPRTITFCGGLGMGQVARIAHNWITLANNLVATEGMAIGLKYGIDKRFYLSFEQPVPGLVPEAPSSNNYKRAFAPALSVKDLTIGINAAKKVDINPTAGEAVIKAFREVDADPRTHDLDHTSLWLHVYGNLDEWAKEKHKL
ncbi:NAD binding domain of 6-phosphogluconate dehydrogenase-domain-containing protein [Thelonectria olida]|uniref:NAD binding domain of 6-phosphogluconate dehydrogenase-domain-containing protein n=1 Tax=Thelonectria olida TaxID=1576542 RepID=A0A9P8VWZ4_9HYPO|nr:NAD binding domain of 6-phosphogluconate dehydrogenase-domain-containing protein [Thelonectria olida]